MAAKKQYGLIITKSKPQVLTKSSAFDEDSSDEDNVDARKRQVSASLRKEGMKRLEAKTTKNMLSEALCEDPSVFDYDGVYDQMQEKKRDSKLLGKQDRKSKYIANLKRTAEVRKIEQELAYERKVQKERETEGETFSDKDSFVTPSYLRKLEERAAIEERLRKEEEIEKLNDVTKETDLSRFYRNVLERKTTGAPSSTTEEEELDIKKEDRGHDDYTDTTQDNDNEPSDQAGSEEDESDNNEEGSDNEGSSSEKETEELDQEERQEVKEDSPPIPTVPEPQPETIEERRKRIFAKRTDEESALSAKERYLARKKAKLSEPTVITEDD